MQPLSYTISFFGSLSESFQFFREIDLKLAVMLQDCRLLRLLLLILIFLTLLRRIIPISNIIVGISSLSLGFCVRPLSRIVSFLLGLAVAFASH